MNTHNAQTFSAFHNNFIAEQESLLQRLMVAMEPENLSRNQHYHKNIIEQVLSTYHCYYHVKSITARTNVFVFLSPPWLSSFERSLLWLSEFKPSLIFRILACAVTDLTADQAAMIETVKAETRTEERELMDTMARVQDSVASPPILNIARRFGRPVADGELSEAEAAMEALQMAMVAVVEGADGLRGRTVLKVRAVLSEVQMLRFLAAAVQFQLRVRSYGRGEIRREMVLMGALELCFAAAEVWCSAWSDVALRFGGPTKTTHNTKTCVIY